MSKYRKAMSRKSSNKVFRKGTRINRENAPKPLSLVNRGGMRF